MRLVTITLGDRKWMTTNRLEANCFIAIFGSDDFKMDSVPYEGKSIDWIVSLN
jgi:hypothetical protein